MTHDIAWIDCQHPGCTEVASSSTHDTSATSTAATGTAATTTEATMPRKNRTPRRKRRQQEPPTPPDLTPFEMALLLVRDGKASELILGGFRPDAQ